MRVGDVLPAITRSAVRASVGLDSLESLDRARPARQNRKTTPTSLPISSRVG